jgi:cell shape-determining protein MreC
MLLGAVQAVSKKESGLFQSIAIQPSVDFSKLEEIIVLIARGDSKR